MCSVSLGSQAVQRDAFALWKPLVQGLAMGATRTASAGRQLDAGQTMYCWQASQLNCKAYLAGDQSR